MLANKEISSVELTQTFLNRIAKHNPGINAYIALDEAKTLAQAKAADAMIASGKAQALTGIPFAQKDIFCATGLENHVWFKNVSEFHRPLRCACHQPI
jgi:aspartyl-tRNA(Asn)/glutamyl-tRNA(Gln) amidotransferase subunit A